MRAFGVLLSTPAGKILAVALLMTILLIAAMLLTLLTPESSYGALPAITIANLVFGRAAGIATGFASSMHPISVVIINMYIETTLVLLVFSLFLMVWERMLVHEKLKNFVESFTKSAQKYEESVRKYGPIGLFFFVFFPFWMTGPTVGCIIGYFMGLSIKKNLMIVLGGTNVAIVIWALFLSKLQSMLERYDASATWAIVAFLALLGIGAYMYRFFSRR